MKINESSKKTTHMRINWFSSLIRNPSTFSHIGVVGSTSKKYIMLAVVDKDDRFCYDVINGNIVYWLMNDNCVPWLSDIT